MTDFETVESWKERLDLTDEEVLTPEYLNRISSQSPIQENEIIYCACGCGEFWLRRKPRKRGVDNVEGG